MSSSPAKRLPIGIGSIFSKVAQALLIPNRQSTASNLEGEIHG
jgi:hypothetical protein